MDEFANAVWRYYKEHGRHDLPWRLPEANGSFDPYKIMVSELMLQQTQVPRVIPKFTAFIKMFPTVEALAAAPLADVLLAWSGLGYNRRAKFLWQAAVMAVRDYEGKLPKTTAELVRLPGIGPNTAGAILAYAYNQPAAFIETNIRTVFIHHFFAAEQEIDDRLILDLVARSLADDVRQWYWALMDYGTHLKQEVGNLNKLSKHYTKQSRFAGSRRQVRGQVLRVLAAGPLSLAALRTKITDERLPEVLEDLARESMVMHTGRYFRLGTSDI